MSPIPQWMAAVCYQKNFDCPEFELLGGKISTPSEMWEIVMGAILEIEDCVERRIGYANFLHASHGKQLNCDNRLNSLARRGHTYK